MRLEAEQLQDLHNLFFNYIDKYIQGHRKDELRELYESYGDRLLLAPGSGTISYHNCFPGGYIDHVCRVVHYALRISSIWEEEEKVMNLRRTYTTEELVFAAINHDLGKLGMPENGMGYYQANTNEWQRRVQGKMYIQNPDLPFMKVPDRSLFILAQRGIPVTENEWYAIKLHDGMYVEDNKSYYMGYTPEMQLRSTLPYVLHQADILASKMEHRRWKAEEENTDQPKKTKTSKKKKLEDLDVTKDETPVDQSDLEDLFSTFD